MPIRLTHMLTTYTGGGERPLTSDARLHGEVLVAHGTGEARA